MNFLLDIDTKTDRTEICRHPTVLESEKHSPKYVSVKRMYLVSGLSQRVEQRGIVLQKSHFKPHL